MTTRQLSVLVVDFDEDYARALEQFFAEKQILTLVAFDGAQGLKLFKNKKPDIVITTIILPVLDGLDLIKAIRRINVEVPIIVTRNYFEGCTTEIALKEQYMVNYVTTRPPDWQALTLEIERMLAEPVENERSIS